MTKQMDTGIIDRAISKTNHFMGTIFRQYGNQIVNIFTVITLLIWVILFLFVPANDLLKWSITQITGFISILFGYIFYWMQKFSQSSPKPDISLQDKSSTVIFLASALWTLAALLTNIIRAQASGYWCFIWTNLYHYKDCIMAIISSFNSLCFLVVMKELTVYKKTADAEKF